jgi:hypothetical protein
MSFFVAVRCIRHWMRQKYMKRMGGTFNNPKNIGTTIPKKMEKNEQNG